MPTEQLLNRLPTICRLLLGDYRDAIGLVNIVWLTNRREHNDWLPEDVVRIREMLPTRLRWLLSAGSDE